MKITKYCLIVLLFICSLITVSTINAQSTRSDFSPYWEVNINGGLSTFFGDLKQNTILPSSEIPSEWKFGGGFMIGRQFTPLFAFRAQFLTADLLGQKKEIDRYFESNYYEANINFTINLNNVFGRYKADRKLNLYFVSGIGVSSYKSILRKISTGDALKYSGFGNGNGIEGRIREGVFMAGIGADYIINDRISIQFESVSRAMNSDKMDFYNDDKPYDFYNYTSIGIAYRFGKRKSRTLSTPIKVPEVVEEAALVVLDQKPPEIIEIAEEIIIKPKTNDIKKNVQAVVEPEIIVEALEEEPLLVEQPKILELEYRVQIRASYQKRLSKEFLSDIYNIAVEDIKENKYLNYYIYTIGSFKTYNQANDMHYKLRSTNKVLDAFVVAFRNGERLSKMPK